MLKNNKELFLSFLGVAAFKVHMWNLKRKSKQLLEKNKKTMQNILIMILLNI
ncbi:hypothetical protein K144313037_p10220 (plasmid) [Clostridium tetani]|uniref:hypothetical protein n=1 Tax=Clostridium tetani TaxID=1513 RepID=UPI0029547D3A|nr:hypothetical protein [Clostridium tetani]BDR71155.1 hypothetical protein K144313037_p10220 [Clostridium tetani]BEV20792.1 hypothetical protein K154301001_26470 [Clostridium tetani]